VFVSPKVHTESEACPDSWGSHKRNCTEVERILGARLRILGSGALTLGSGPGAAIFGVLSPCSTAKHERPRRGELYDMRALSLSSVCLLLSLTTSALSSPAMAQSGPKPYPACDREPTSADISGAKGAYEAGQASFNEADYARAILYWEDAFRRDCTAAKLLLNLARAYELSGKKEHAVLALETYLERRPDAPDRPSIEKRIENLRAQVAAETKPEPVEPPVVAATTTAAAPEEIEPAPAPVEVEKSKRPVWPVIMTVSGAVVAGVGLGFTLDAAATLADVDCPLVEDVPTCNANPPATSTPQEERDRANTATTQRTIGLVSVAVGTGFLAAGAAAWYFSWKDRRRETSAHVLPVLAPGYAGLSVHGRF
jgi:hypothetical protein